MKNKQNYLETSETQTYLEALEAQIELEEDDFSCPIEPLINKFDFSFEIEMNINNITGRIKYKTTINSDYDFVDKYEQLLIFYNKFQEENTRQILTEKTK